MTDRVLPIERQSEHLQKVSRTFAVTIPLLPPPLSDWVANAYLLCRAADTVEDDPRAAAEGKAAWLTRFAAMAGGGFADGMELMALHAQALALTAAGARPAEGALLRDLPALVARLDTFPAAAREAVCRGLCIMSYGMARCANGFVIRTGADVDRYCYYVAGVVGEMLAHLFAVHAPDLDRQKLLRLAVSFGEGLQLTNILKDRRGDARRRASFLPPPGGETPAGQLREYAATTMGHLDDARDFILCIPARRRGLRAFCLMNVAMATATLRVLLTTPDTGTAPLKITRAAVRRLLRVTALVVGNNLAVRGLHAFLSRGLPRRGRDPEALRRRLSWWDRQAYNILLTEERG